MMDYFFLLSFIITCFLCFQEGKGKKCPSMCTRDVVGCRNKGGKVIGYCTNNLACCDLTYKSTGTCGDTKSGFSTIDFISPGYPSFSKQELLCTFAFSLLEDTIGVKVEFLEVTMDGLGFAGNGAACDSDMFYFKGFKIWTPPALCGNLTGYTTVIDRGDGQEFKMDHLHIVALMSSEKYRWKIKLTQISKGKVAKILTRLPNKYSVITKRQQQADTIVESTGDHSRQPQINDELFTVRRRKRSLEIKRKSRVMSSSAENQRSRQRSIFFHPNPDAENIFINNDDSREEEDASGLAIPMIVNGHDTEIREAPWQVSIRMKHIPKADNSSNSTSSEEENDVDVDDHDDAETIGKVNNNSTDISNGTFNVNDTLTTPTLIPERNCSAEEGSHFCGGTIIAIADTAIILTAAHCFYGSSKSQGMEQLDKIKIVLGDSDTCTVDSTSPKPEIFSNHDTNSSQELNNEKIPRFPQQEFEIETVVLHYAYDNTALLNDIALVKLKTPIDFNTQVKKIRLAEPDENFQGQLAMCSGWGKTNLTDKSAHLPHLLQSSQFFVVRNQSECDAENERLFGAPLKNVTTHPKYRHAFQSVLCTSSKHNNSKGEVLVGPGDSGGPLVILKNNKTDDTILIGVVSYGIPPAKPKHSGEYVDFFQSVAYFRSWINIAVAGIM